MNYTRRRTGGAPLICVWGILLGAILQRPVHGGEPMPNGERIAIIAHRGASGYLPEHTLEAKAMAFAQGADFLEQDLVLTRDDVPIVLHDIHLDTVTDVARKFPDRAREDGRYYAVDFTLAEIRELNVTERIDIRTGKAVFPGRFPQHQGRFRIPTFEEEIVFVQGLNTSAGKSIGIYPEIKQPRFHHAEGKDLAKIALEILHRYGYRTKDDPVYVQCFDHAETERLRQELHCELRLVQLLERERWLDPAAGEGEQRLRLGMIARYADAIGPPLKSIFLDAPREGEVATTRLVELAHSLGLLVHPWTYRADQLPAPFQSFEELHRASAALTIDGLFTDFPDLSARFLRK